MFYDLFLAFLIGGLSGLMFSFLSYRTILTRLWSLEEQIDVLSERHLSAVRRGSINKRWQADDDLDLKIEQTAAQAVSTKPKGWTKWGSKSASSSDGSAAAS